MAVVDLGRLEGPVVVFGGPYSNLHALEALLETGADPARMISTGDLVAYCADAAPVVARVRGLGIPVVAGNCEKQLGAGLADCDCGFAEGSVCSVLAEGWYAHALNVLGAEDRGWLAARPDRVVFEHEGKRWGVIHGGATQVNRFIWPVSADAVLEDEIAALEGEVGPLDGVIAGHSGIAFERAVGRHMWVNAGALGMPQNDGSTDVRYLVLDDAPRIERLRYNHEAAAAAMEAAGLVQGYERALRSGWWPSEDVLPGEMRRAELDRAG